MHTDTTDGGWATMKDLPIPTTEKIRAIVAECGVAYVNEKTGEVFSPSEVELK